MNRDRLGVLRGSCAVPSCACLSFDSLPSNPSCKHCGHSAAQHAAVDELIDSAQSVQLTSLASAETQSSMSTEEFSFWAL
eukprot:m51a1_g11001 hypothetical protein (80) ;mRNA; f:356691-357090